MRLTAAIVMLLAAAGAVRGSAVVTMSDAAAVSCARVTLSDVATVDAPSPAERSRLSSVVVAYLSCETDEVLVDSETVRGALSGVGVNLAEVSICGAATSKVTRADNSRSLLVGAIERYVSSRFPKDSPGISGIVFDFKPVAGLSPVVTSAEPSSLEGRVRFAIADVREDSKTVGHVWADVARKVPVVVARRRVSAGRVIEFGDVAVEHRDASEGAAGVASLAEAVGRRVVSTIEPGSVLSGDSLISLDVVKRGDEVALEYTRDGLVISMRLRALENAAVGDVVRLKRQGERGEHLGRITGPGMAVPALGGDE